MWSTASPARLDVERCFLPPPGTTDVVGHLPSSKLLSSAGHWRNSVCDRILDIEKRVAAAQYVPTFVESRQWSKLLVMVTAGRLPWISRESRPRASVTGFGSDHGVFASSCRNEKAFMWSELKLKFCRSGWWKVGGVDAFCDPVGGHS